MRIDVMHVSLATLLVGALVLHPQDPKPAAPAAPTAGDPAAAAAEAAAMEAMKKAAAPGPNHQFLAQMEGNWIAQCKMVMDPAAPPMTFTAKVSNDMDIGGRFLKGEWKAKLGPQQEKFTGFSLMGFDNVAQKFSGVWVDTWGTQIMPISWGTLDQATRTITMLREFKDPMNGKMRKEKDVIVVTSANEYRMDIFLSGDDLPEYKMLESAFTKAPAKPEKDKSKEAK